MQLSKLEVYVLAVLNHGPKHVYSIRKTIANASQVGLAPGATTIYEAVCTLEAKELVARGQEYTVNGRTRKEFCITLRGVEAFRHELAILQALIAQP